jgi:hypothetical protein
MSLDPLLPWATRHPTFNLQYNFVLRNLCLEEYMISIQNFNTSLLKRTWLQYINFNTSLLSLHAINKYIIFQYMYWGLSKQKKGGEYILDVGGGFFCFHFHFIWKVSDHWIFDEKNQGKIASPKTFIFPSWIMIQWLAMSLSKWLFVLMIHYKIMVLDLGIKCIFGLIVLFV